MEKIGVKYRSLIRKMIACRCPAPPVSAASVYREANLSIRPFIDEMIEESLTEPSEIRGFQHLEQLAAQARSGAACLLLVEHFSNFDLPVLSYLLRRLGSSGRQIADAVIAVAGMKLEEDGPVVSAFAEAYRRIIIFPRRSANQQPEAAAHFLQRRAINLAAAKEIRKKKNEGNLILVFPAGTRYRPADPTTRQGQRETDSYIRSFDSMCLLSINGNILRVQDEGGMAEDVICRDRITISAGPVLDCRAFRESVRKQTPAGSDRKQAVADEVMRRLARLHAAAESR